MGGAAGASQPLPARCCLPPDAPDAATAGRVRKQPAKATQWVSTGDICASCGDPQSQSFHTGQGHVPQGKSQACWLLPCILEEVLAWRGSPAVSPSLQPFLSHRVGATTPELPLHN